MLRFALLLVAALMMNFNTMAQDSTQPAQPASPPASHHTRSSADMAERKLKAMTRRLELTPDQQEKMRPILQDEAKQVQSVESDSSLDEHQKHRKVRDIHMESKSSMQGILTTEQQAKIHNGRTGRGHNHRSPTPSTTPPSPQSTPQ